MKTKLEKWLKWEFWPLWFFYIPVYVKFLWLSLRARTMAFYTASNPLMELGGLTEYSKYKVLSKINPEYLPTTVLIKETSAKAVLNEMQRNSIAFPIILKPDIGERGFGVEKIDSDEKLIKYFKNGRDFGDLILQEYVPYTLELGIMYSRKNSEQNGKISSVVMKEFLKIKGDGTKTLQELLKSSNRAKFYLESLLEMYQNELNSILEKDQEKELVAIGNHCRGTSFLDANYLINKELHAVFDEISIPIEGYYFGRFDLRVSSLEDLYQGKNIKIMELNGAASEPAHIYDPSMSLLKAYRDLFAHWQRLFEISIENHKNGIPYAKTREVFLALRRRGKVKKLNQN